MMSGSCMCVREGLRAGIADLAEAEKRELHQRKTGVVARFDRGQDDPKLSQMCAALASLSLADVLCLGASYLCCAVHGG